MKKTDFAMMLMVIGVSACTSPGVDPPTAPTVASVAPTVSATPATPAGRAAGKAKVCEISGLAWGGRESQIEPMMTVSNDGSCGTHIHLSNQTAAIMQVERPPNHGQITTADNASSSPRFRYAPDPGYVGADRFVMLMGSVQHQVYADFDVTVTQ